MKYRTASPQWIAALHGAMAVRAATEGLDGAEPFALCEVFTGVPADVHDSTDGRVAWTWRVSDGAFEFDVVESDAVDVKMEFEYDAVVPLTRMATTDGEQALEEMTRALNDAVATGRAKITGQPETAPQIFAPIHDVMATVTE